ncbi:hypothetical protein QBC38DRAFT_43016 [Podospora fimiseda]|uniref:GPI inositol-deacylase n=1 Tax=Podospora fimiseda TaxID=252190 RepID=A0AAN7GVH5_9PEZI|nr:hypothetical protein QBC38DRAFT_43016 [Podospora fimiseda]
MHLSRNSSEPSSSFRSLLSRTFSLGRPKTQDIDPSPKGPLGLTTLHVPSKGRPVVAEIIFVHGLNGGSQSTWSYGNKPANFWPKEWLPRDEVFNDVRIHTFGYPSGLNRESILNIADFARSLLAAVNDCPAMRLEHQPHVRIIFVAHSMGKYLAAAGPNTVRIWSPCQGTEVSHFKIGSRCLSLEFVEEDAVLRVATQQNQLIDWDMDTKTFVRDEPLTWTGEFEETMQFITPDLVAVRPAGHLIAVCLEGRTPCFGIVRRKQFTTCTRKTLALFGHSQSTISQEDQRQFARPSLVGG